MTRNEHAVLNRLIESCRDSERGFRLAADEVTDPALRDRFRQVADERAQFAAELAPHANRLGGDAARDGTAVAALHRRWMTLKRRLLHDDGTIVSEVELGDRSTLSTYADALQGMLPPDTRWLVERQREAIEASHARISMPASGLS